MDYSSNGPYPVMDYIGRMCVGPSSSSCDLSQLNQRHQHMQQHQNQIMPNGNGDMMIMQKMSVSSPPMMNFMPPNSLSAGASRASISTPSPNLPSSNSWPGCFGQPQRRYGDMGASDNLIPFDMSSRMAVFELFRMFSSRMANNATELVRIGNFKSAAHWYDSADRKINGLSPNVQNGRVNSNGSEPTQTNQKPPTKARKRKQDLKNRTSPAQTNGTTFLNSSPHMPQVGSNGASSNNSEQRLNVDHPIGSVPSTSNDLLMLGDEETTGDDPLRRMERMTQDTLFEPPQKNGRTSNCDPNLSAKREEDRNAKLEKMEALEHQLLNNRNKLDAQAQAKWGVMLQDHEGQKMQCQQPMMHPYGNQAPMMLTPGYHSGPPQNGPQIHPSFQRPPYQQFQMRPPSASSPITMSAAPQIRTSLAPGPHNGQYALQDNFACMGGYRNAYYAQGCPPHEMQQQIMPNMTYNQIYHQAPSAQGFSMYNPSLRPIYIQDKMPQGDIWNRQFPQSINNLEARVPSQKIQYHPSGAIFDENFQETMNNTVMYT